MICPNTALCLTSPASRQLLPTTYSMTGPMPCIKATQGWGLLGTGWGMDTELFLDVVCLLSSCFCLENVECHSVRTSKGLAWAISAREEAAALLTSSSGCSREARRATTTLLDLSSPATEDSEGLSDFILSLSSLGLEGHWLWESHSSSPREDIVDYLSLVEVNQAN